MELIENQGYTNKTYHDKSRNLFVKVKSYDPFNHKIDYKILNTLDFSPKVVFDDAQKLETKWIDGLELNPNNLTNEQLKIIGKELITLHNSKLKFPKQNQIARRFKIYLQKISSLNKKVPIIDRYYNKLNTFLKNIDTSAPCHNDLWLFNMIFKNNIVYITDWEYASMGDVHFDLAYFIESSNLTKDQEKVFFEAYGDDYEPKYLLIHRIIVNALIVLWINSHEINPFSDEIYNERVEKYMQEYLSKYN
ncbi:hypothetical protein MSATCC14277_6060 [Metamycoplasma salivarium]|uniref:phosphotransferase n=1 Tax=Metamycoplasma salivarium TaxID=2124 RepID=UPI001F3C9619|nr:phosphotransferase [Metamycoplasma salivarium]GIZ06024.1 hypothetical protein MSATCC14277_6060 [Metamycoplasma salivarium]